MSILTDLWNGEVAPCDQRTKNDRRYAEANRRIQEGEEQLLSLLPPEKQEVYQQYYDAMVTSCAMEQADAFARGFRLGVRLLLAALET